MDLRRSTTRVFDDLDPAVEWKQAGDDRDEVEITLPGFRKDHVRVQVDNHGVLRATGERPTGGGRWARFVKDLRLPENCDADAIRARFQGDKLIITLPIAAPPPPPGFETPSSDTPSAPGSRTTSSSSRSPSPRQGPTRWPPAYSEPPPPRPSPPQPSLPPPPPPPPPPRPTVVHEIPTRRRPPKPLEPPRPPKDPQRPPPPRHAPVTPTVADELTKAEPKPSSSPLPNGTAASVPETRTPAFMETAISVSPPSPLPPPQPHTYVAPKQDVKAPEKAGEVRKRSPEENRKERRKRERKRGEVRGKVDDAMTDGTPSEKKQAPTTALARPDPARQLLVNTVAAAAVLVGIIMAVWNTLRS